MQFLSNSYSETFALGERLASLLAPGAVVAFKGDLGAGKTAFISGMAKGLSVDGRVTSPTYTIVNEYNGTIPLFHFDLYRLTSADDLYDIGWEDYLARGGVCAVEWSERAPEEFADAIAVDIKILSDTGRSITITGGIENALSCH